jgi:hypothetical protein
LFITNRKEANAMPSKGIFGIGISIFFLGLILWGGWNVYHGLRKSFNEANAASNNLVNQCMKQLPTGSSVCDHELRHTLQQSSNNGISNFLMMKKQDICDDGKVNHYYQLRAAHSKATGR